MNDTGPFRVIFSILAALPWNSEVFGHRLTESWAMIAGMLFGALVGSLVGWAFGYTTTERNSRRDK